MRNQRTIALMLAFVVAVLGGVFVAIDRLRSASGAPELAHLKKGSNGHLLKNSSGHLVKECGGCDDPCNTASGTQPSAVVTVVGGGFCDDAAEAEGTFAWDAFADEASYCRWTWRKSGTFGDWLLIVQYCKTGGTWCSWIINEVVLDAHFGIETATCACATATDISVANLTCDAGELTGTFSLIGDTSGGPGVCEDDTATVTLNP